MDWRSSWMQLTRMNIRVLFAISLRSFSHSYFTFSLFFFKGWLSLSLSFFPMSNNLVCFFALSPFDFPLSSPLTVMQSLALHLNYLPICNFLAVWKLRGNLQQYSTQQPKQAFRNTRARKHATLLPLSGCDLSRYYTVSRLLLHTFYNEQTEPFPLSCVIYRTMLMCSLSCNIGWASSFFDSLPLIFFPFFLLHIINIVNILASTSQLSFTKTRKTQGTSTGNRSSSFL